MRKPSALHCLKHYQGSDRSSGHFEQSTWQVWAHSKCTGQRNWGSRCSLGFPILLCLFLISNHLWVRFVFEWCHNPWWVWKFEFITFWFFGTAWRAICDFFGIRCCRNVQICKYKGKRRHGFHTWDRNLSRWLIELILVERRSHFTCFHHWLSWIGLFVQGHIF